MKKSKLLRKVFAAALAVAMVGGTAVATPVGLMIGTNITASAASASPVVTVGDYQYILYSDKTAKVVGYNGTKDLSTTHIGMPSVIYSKDINTTWSYNEYIDSYSITQMQAGIFSGCKFKTLTLPSNLQAITGGFTGAEIGGILISSTNSYFSSTYSNGAYALYNKSNTTLYAYPSNPELYVSGFGTATKGFPSTLTRVEDQAFANSKLYTVNLPSTVTYIGDRVFTGSSVNYVTFEGDAPTFRFLPSSTIPDHGTFEGAASLFQIKINGTNGDYNTDSYGNLYNKDLTKLILVPQGRTSAFNLASTCTEIGDYAFYHSNANGPVIYDQVKTINTYAFSGVKSNFKVYCLKDTPTETFVKNKSMSYTYAYEYTTASDGVTITKYNGPYSSPGVPTSINGSSVIAIGDEAFRDNTSLTYVYLYSPIRSIGNYAFYGCSNMKKVSMPYTVTEIGERAFYNCSSLTSLSLPTRLQKIGTYGFGYCKALTDVTLPNSVTQLNYGAFFGCSGLSSVKIGTGVKNIGAFAFENTALTTQYIPSNVTSIGDNAFGYTYSSSHTRNSSFTSISGMPDTAAETYAKDNNITFNSDLTYSFSSDGNSVTIEKYQGSQTNLVIPDTIGGKLVTSIKNYAFNGSTVESVTLPASMTQLDGYAFYGASKLKSVTFPSTITSIGSYAFEFCSSLTSINIPGTVKSIGTGAFYGCTALSNVTLNSGLQSIGKYAFTNVALTSVTVPKTVTSINEHAFAYTYANGEYTPVSSFTMTGYVDTAAESYALNNTHITFKPQYETFSNTSSVDKTSIALGETVKVSAGATGGKKPYTYAVYYKKGTAGSSNSYTTLQNFSTNASVNFKPTSSGTYTIMVTASDYRNVTASKTITVTVNAPELINNSSISAATVKAGEDITVTGKASGGEGEYSYKVLYQVKDAPSWKIVQFYDSNSNISFSIDTAGEYTVCVDIIDGNNTVASKYFNITVELDELVNDSSLSNTKINLGESITINGAATGGTAPYTYAVYYKQKSQTTWTAVQSTYAATITKTITPKAATAYTVRVKVKDAAGTIVNKDFTVNVTKALTNTSTISATSIPLGKSLTLAGSATGGTAPYTYAVYYKQKSQTTWTAAQSTYAATITKTITPKAATTYTIRVKVKDSTGTIVNKDFTVDVKKELTNTSTISATSIPLGKSLTLTGSATGGTAPYTYAVYYKQKSQTTWTAAQSTYSATITNSITPKAATTYTVRVKVKDSAGTIVNKDFTVNVTKPLTNTSTISAESITLGDSVTLTGAATGGTDIKQYIYYCKLSTASSWTTIQGYSTAVSATFTPDKTGTYDICIKVKDESGLIVKKYFTLTVK